MKKEAILWSKFTIISCLQLVAFVALAILAYFVSVSFATYGWEYVIYDETKTGGFMPMTDEAIRAALMWVVAISAFIIGYSIFTIVKLYPINNKMVFTLGILNWALLPYLFIQARKNKYFTDFHTFLKVEREEGLQISHKLFLEVLCGKAKPNKLFWNTCLGYLTFLCTLVGFLSILSTSNYANIDGEKGSNFFFHIFVWFTSFSNEVLFVFMLAFVCLHKRNFFRENSMLIYVTGYLLVVFLVYWCYLVPTDGFAEAPVDIFKSIWLHAVNPVLIIVFCITSFFQNYTMPKKKLYSFCLMGCVLPMTYGLFAYLISFVLHFSIYGSITNMNFWMINIEGENMGGAFGFVGFIALFIVFNLTFLLFWFINYKIAKKHNGATPAAKVPVTKDPAKSVATKTPVKKTAVKNTTVHATK